MRIFERLRGRSRSDSAIERKLFEAVTDGLLRKLEGETPIPVFTESNANCCSCCSFQLNHSFAIQILLFIKF